MADKDTTSTPGQWRLESAGLHMRADGAEAGKLARLGDVVLWLMQEGELPRKTAVARLCDALETASPAAVLFLVRPDEYAAPLGDREWFASVSGNPVKQRKFSSGIDLWGDQPREAQEPKETPSLGTGLSGALAWIRRGWVMAGDAAVLSRKDALATYLAVSTADAARLWGWGVAEDEAPSAARPADASPEPADGVLSAAWLEAVASRKAAREKNPKARWTVAEKEAGRDEFERLETILGSVAQPRWEAMARPLGIGAKGLENSITNKTNGEVAAALAKKQEGAGTRPNRSRAA